MKWIIKEIKSLMHLHVLLLLLTDSLLLLINALITYLVTDTLTPFKLDPAMLIILIFCFVFFSVFGLGLFRVYRAIYKYYSAGELLSCVLGILVGQLLFLGFGFLIELPFPWPFYPFAFLLSICTVCVERMIYNHITNRIFLARKCNKSQPTLIIGAGDTGTNVLKEILRSKDVDYKPIGFVDDDQRKIDHVIDGVPIFGPTILLPELCKKNNIKVIIFAIPSCSESKRNKILSICAETGCEIRMIPTLWELATDVKFLPQVKKINVEDVLGRNVIKMDTSDFIPFIRGKIVMVTGVGSIGSEICRQLIKYDIKHLIMVDIYENNAYEIQQELFRKGYKDKITTVIASVRDYAKMKSVFEKYKPDIVFHAAAHKHVPLMEDNPEEAVKNNVLGTYNIAKLSKKFDVSKMVLISTDKAVNPTNVMGASKRCCEMVMQYMAQKKSNTEYVAVRFGNVLGSNGSVIPLFIKQIESGGPVTVTHPDIIRYFMTIPEAVALVLEAGAMAHGGEIFVLDMGEPVKITTLAENIIKLYGYKPYTEMPIEFIGLRPGEKLFEELLMDEEGLKSTKNKSIFIGNQININTDVFEQELKGILNVAESNDKDSVVEALKAMVPTFKHK